MNATTSTAIFLLIFGWRPSSVYASPPTVIHTTLIALGSLISTASTRVSCHTATVTVTCGTDALRDAVLINIRIIRAYRILISCIAPQSATKHFVILVISISLIGDERCIIVLGPDLSREPTREPTEKAGKETLLRLSLRLRLRRRHNGNAAGIASGSARAIGYLVAIPARCETIVEILGAQSLTVAKILTLLTATDRRTRGAELLAGLVDPKHSKNQLVTYLHAARLGLVRVVMTQVLVGIVVIRIAA